MKILFLDDEAVRHEMFDLLMGSEHEIWHAHNFNQFLKQLARGDRFDVISFDHDLGERFDGNDCAKELVRLVSARWPSECWVHSWNPVGAERIVSTLTAAGIPTRRRPFSARGDQ